MMARVEDAGEYSGRMDQTPRDEHADLLSRLEVIEAQPLATRAEAFEALHDELARRLESAPTSA